MSSEKPVTHIGFPPPLLGMRSTRLPVLWSDRIGLALNKPAGIQILPDNWYPRAPLLADSINYQAAKGKPELRRLGIPKEGVRAIYTMEPDVSGVALFATDPELGEFWSNAYGSEGFELTFHFLSSKTVGRETLECDLPIARHNRENRVLVSHSTGKKAFTRFRRLQSIGRYHLWEAVTRYYRMHQLPLHALEVGLDVVGDTFYSRSEPIYLSQIKRHYRQGKDEIERPLYPHAALHLVNLRVPMPDGGLFDISAPVPDRMGVLLKKLRDAS